MPIIGVEVMCGLVIRNSGDVENLLRFTGLVISRPVDRSNEDGDVSLN